jgi:hypothetical protein
MCVLAVLFLETDAALQAAGVPKYMFSAAQEEKGQVPFRMHARTHTALL